MDCAACRDTPQRIQYALGTPEACYGACLDCCCRNCQVELHTGDGLCDACRRERPRPFIPRAMWCVHGQATDMPCHLCFDARLEKRLEIEADGLWRGDPRR